MCRVVLATMGSWGDIFPAIGLAKGLIGAGRDARIAASPAYDELVRGGGGAFAGIGPMLGFSDSAPEPQPLPPDAAALQARLANENGLRKTVRLVEAIMRG